MNSKAINLRVAVARLVPSKMTRAALCESLGLSESRLAVLLEGDMPTQAEGIKLAKVLGGSPDDYRDFVLQEDPWFTNQTQETKAEIARILTSSRKDLLQDLEDGRRFGKRMARLGIAASIAILACLANVVWVNHRYNTLRPDAYRYATRMYGQRDLAIATTGIEESKALILRIRAISSIVDTSWAGDRAGLIKLQSFLLDGVRYYQNIGQMFEERAHRDRTILEAPHKAKMDNRVFDIQTGQEVDLEDPNGGKLDMDKLRDLVQAQMRSKEFLKLANDLAKAPQDLSHLPPLTKWLDTARQGQDGPLALPGPTATDQKAGNR